jgi:uncharacterized protein
VTEMDIVIRDDPDEGAYVMEVDGDRAGKAEYRDRDGSRVFRHTEVDDRLSGEGLGSKLVRHALDDVRASGGKVVPLCPFFAAYIKRHPEYKDLVDQEMTEMYRERIRERG